MPAIALYALALLAMAYGLSLALELSRRVGNPPAAPARARAAAGLALGIGSWLPLGVLLLAALPGDDPAGSGLDGRALLLSVLVSTLGALACVHELAARRPGGAPHPSRAGLWLGGSWLLGLQLGCNALPSALRIDWPTIGALDSAGASTAPALCCGLIGAQLATRLAVAGTRLAGAHRRGLLAVSGATSALALASLHSAVRLTPGEGTPAGAPLALIGLGLTLGVVLLVLLAQGAAWQGSRLDTQAHDLATSLQRANDQLQQANAELVRQAFVDPLTGLPNRALLDDRLGRAGEPRARARAATEAGATRPAVLFIDLDGFKPVNDAYGHAVGDDLLCAVASRLQALCRAVDTLARLGGDEFVILIERLDDMAEAVAVAERVLAAMQQPFELQERRLTLSCSIGIAAAPLHGPSDRLLIDADLAMYVAKQAGGGTWRVFEPAMEDGVVDQLELQQALREALAQGSFTLHYQPKVEAATGRLVGAEALLRWDHPERGAISPARFVPVAERFGLIVPLGAWVIDEACRQLAAWQAAGRRLPVSVNLSGYQLRQPDLADRIAQAMSRHGVGAGQLVFEITESVAMEDGGTPRAVLESLASRGLHLSIDDFGTGHSSLAALRQLRAHELKIDRSFVQDVAHDDDARAVVDAVVRLARALGLRVVAEGVETREQRDVLVQLGCDELQGYLYSRPLVPSAMPDDGALLPQPQPDGSRPTLRRVA